MPVSRTPSCSFLVVLSSSSLSVSCARSGSVLPSLSPLPSLSARLCGLGLSAYCPCSPAAPPPVAPSPCPRVFPPSSPCPALPWASCFALPPPPSSLPPVSIAVFAATLCLAGHLVGSPAFPGRRLCVPAPPLLPLLVAPGVSSVSLCVPRSPEVFPRLPFLGLFFLGFRFAPFFGPLPRPISSAGPPFSLLPWPCRAPSPPLLVVGFPSRSPLAGPGASLSGLPFFPFPRFPSRPFSSPPLLRPLLLVGLRLLAPPPSVPRLFAPRSPAALALPRSWPAPPLPPSPLVVVLASVFPPSPPPRSSSSLLPCGFPLPLSAVCVAVPWVLLPSTSALRCPL